MVRRVGFCVNRWASQETFFAWTWLKEHLIHSEDELHIIHIRSKGDDDKWNTGGPVQPELARAMEKYRHFIHEIEGVRGVGQLLVDQEVVLQLDILVLGVREQNRIRRTINSVTDQVVINSTCPCIIIRPKAPSGDIQRLRSQMITGSGSPRQEIDIHRRVAILRTSDEEANQSLYRWQSSNNVLHTDEVLVISFRRKKDWQSSDVNQATPCLQEYVHQENSNRLGGYREVTLMGDPKKSLSTLLESQGIDLLIISRATNSKALYRRSPCPCLVIPSSAPVSPPRVISTLKRLGSIATSRRINVRGGFRGARRRSRSLSDVQISQIQQHIQDIHNDRPLFASNEVVLEDDEEEDEEEAQENGQLVGDDDDDEEEESLDGIAIEMIDKECQTSDYGEPNGGEEEYQEIIDKLQTQLEQKDSLIKDLHERLNMMQQQISYIMDSHKQHSSDLVSVNNSESSHQ
eukprot:TRINITY_DN4060_c0_g3_i3.p1 TRINITY_DN4060_c0_g3~~TRINITY_DN4060_c0_g3_i3.p1  ORF type:complete len:461 (-),score=48.79 TRINITY_DN4060_c0_g3_i3:1765-3147(-)